MAQPEIKVVTRDGSQLYAPIISAASEFIMQVSDRFHQEEYVQQSED